MNDNQNPNYKNKGWLKSMLTARSTSEPALEPSSNHEEALIETELSGNTTPDKNLSLFEHDKVALDLVTAVENMLNDRQITYFKNNDIQQQLQSANENTNRLKNELNKKEHLILEKDKEFRSLEDKLTTKQMSYDQLLEDYKEYQNSSNVGMENLKYQLEKERSKYTKINDEFTNHQYESMKKNTELEEKIRDTESENQQLASQYQKVLEEKNQLMQTIADFTARMNFTFSTPSE